MIKNAGKSPKQIQAGDHVYVTNDQRYLSKHILGALEGFNVICIEGNIDEPKFTGLGLPAKGVSLKEINAILIDGFNSDPSNLEFLSSKTKELFKATMSSSEENKKLKTTEEEFYKNEGGQVTIISELDVKFLEELSESTTENGKMLLQNRQVRVQTRN